MITAAQRTIAETIVANVARRLKMHPRDISGPSRHPQYVAARKEIARRLQKHGFVAYPIAPILNRDHTTVLYYLSKKTRVRKSQLSRARRQRIALIDAPV
jgi:chromosomal replication initiation ATPase DnaA